MEEFAATFFEGARPHSETEMSFTNKKFLEEIKPDEPIPTFQAPGEAEIPMELDILADNQDMMETTAVDELTPTIQALGKAETPMRHATAVDQVVLETEAGEVVRVPELQVGVFGKISGCYGWFKTKLRLV